MSASDKKKIRKEERLAALTKKQQEQKAEARKVKAYTIGFVVAMILVVCVVLGALTMRSGIIEKNTVAAVIGDTEISSAELNYYYVDAVNNMYNELYSQFQTSTDTYLKEMGLDVTKPLSEQYEDEEKNVTWAQYFVDLALDQAKRDYVFYNMAMADNFELPEDDRKAFDTSMNNLETYAKLYGYSDADQYIRAMYGYGSDAKGYKEYCERTEIANAYISAHHDSLVYEDKDIREYEKDKKIEYTSYTYTTAYLSYTYFQQGGTKDDQGKITYSDEENDAARAAMKLAVDDLVLATSVEELTTKAEAVEIKEGTTINVKNNKNILYSGVETEIKEWVTNADRKEGDIEAIPVQLKSSDGSENADVINGYYVVIFQGSTDNVVPMGNVRHLLVKFEGGEEDEETGDVIYSDEDKAATKEKADGYLKTWQDGDKTEESFIELVKEHSDDSSKSTGGLFENIHPGSSYVEEFLNWSIDPNRKTGDVEVIETQFGYHVMYYVGASELTYRDYMISNEMRDADHETWYNGLFDAVETKTENISRLNLDMIISG